MKSFWVLSFLVILLAGCAQALPIPTNTPVPPPTATSTAVPVVTQPSSEGADPTSLVTTDSGLQYRDLVVGTGEEASIGATAVVHYTGWLVDGTKFDSSLDRGDPLSFPIGAGRVIQGWDEGVGSMKVGGKRELTIPPDLAYGDRGAGAVIPPGATLIFEVELLELR
ncbi:MAG: FKBP-type peptidyl-prolyl cis-trans isomerase [Chloroflexi bacterium]|nr:FKBP-type peptidyl-prolyl cis-trans isomerase [Chloroflexota bacterium]MDA1218498.1 FKBP-type peptidyl-prolyl cis-trans isomerase [Chloroflexota bacterium]